MGCYRDILRKGWKYLALEKMGRCDIGNMGSCDIEKKGSCNQGEKGRSDKGRGGVVISKKREL